MITSMIGGTKTDWQASLYTIVEEKDGLKLIWIQCIPLDLEIAGRASCQQKVSYNLAIKGVDTRSKLMTNKGSLRLTYYLSLQGYFTAPLYEIKIFAGFD